MKKIIASFITFVSILSLTACTSKYKVDVDITPEDKDAVLAEIKDLKEQIKTYDTSDGTIPFKEIIALSQSYEELGDLDNAIEAYTSWLDEGYRTQAIINNLGKLYEKVGETELAVTQYRRIIDEYQEDRYLYDITWAYINGKQRKEAEKYFNLWQLKFQKTDEQTQIAIKKLRAEEKAAEQQAEL